MSEAHGDADQVLSFETSAPPPWHKADLVKSRDPEQSSGKKRRDMWLEKCFQGAESAATASLELNGFFLICLECWLEAAWQCLLGRQFLAHQFI